jgi:hypothetical protein
MNILNRPSQKSPLSLGMWLIITTIMVFTVVSVIYANVSPKKRTVKATIEYKGEPYGYHKNKQDVEITFED